MAILPQRATVRFCLRDDGATLMEYALIAALASVTIAFTIMALMGAQN